MPKLVTVLRPEKIEEQARDYVRSRILLPAGTIGLVCLVGGALFGPGYWIRMQVPLHLKDDSEPQPDLAVVKGRPRDFRDHPRSALLVVGALCGWAQARYHRYLFTTFPQVYAARLRTAVAQQSKKAKAEPEVPSIEHPGRAFVTAISIAGAALIFSASAVAIIRGDLDPLPAVLVPWAGFYWAKLFCWRGVVD